MFKPMIFFRCLLLTAILLSGVTLAMEIDPRGQYCGFDGGCDEVRSSAFGRVAGIPLPVVGLAGFGSLLILSLVRFRHDGVVRVALASLVAVVSGLLLLVQAVVLAKWCPYCVGIDVIGLSAGALTLASRSVRSPGEESAWRFSWLPAGLLIFILPSFSVLAFSPSPPPEQVSARWIAGKVNVVEVTDFDCEYCQQAEAVLAAVRARDDVHFVRIIAPMPKHPNARIAGRAYLAALRQGRGEEMAAALFKAGERSKATCRKLAGDLGLDLSAYDAVMEDPAIDREFDETIAWAKLAGHGLPMIWVNLERIEGTPTREKAFEAVDRARNLLAPG